MNFASLKARILAVIGRAPADICYELCTADINQTLRLQCMISEVVLVEAETITLPADFMAVSDIYRDADPRTALSPMAMQSIHRAFEASGTPQFYAILNGEMHLTPSPSGAENINLRYYAKLADLVADGDTNNVLTLYPGVYVYGVLRHHATLIRDEKAMAFYESAFNRAGRQAGASDANDRHSGAPLTPMVSTAP